MKSLIPVYGIVFPYMPNIIVLTAVFDRQYYPVAFSIDGQYLLSLEHYLNVSFDEAQHKYILSSIYDSKKLGSIQQDLKKISFYDVSDLHSASCGWDIQYMPQDIQQDSFAMPNISVKTNLQELCPVFKQLPMDRNREFMRLIINLNPSEKAKFKLLFPGLLDQFL